MNERIEQLTSEQLAILPERGARNPGEQAAIDFIKAMTPEAELDMFAGLLETLESSGQTHLGCYLPQVPAFVLSRRLRLMLDPATR